MSFLSDLFSSSVGGVIRDVGDVIDKFHLSGEEKQKFKLEMEALLQKRDADLQATLRTEMESKERVMVAELQQDDKYTKRARPTVVYAGLIFTFINYVLVPAIGSLFGKVIKPLDLPGDFWLAWGGVVGVYALGRSAEKYGVSNRVTQTITGNAPRQPSSLGSGAVG